MSWYWPVSHRSPVKAGKQLHVYALFPKSSWHVPPPSHGLLWHFNSRTQRHEHCQWLPKKQPKCIKQQINRQLLTCTFQSRLQWIISVLFPKNTIRIGYDFTVWVIFRLIYIYYRKLCLHIMCTYAFVLTSAVNKKNEYVMLCHNDTCRISNQRVLLSNNQ